MSDFLLTLNAGSSSIKFALFANDATPEALARGQVDGIGVSPRFCVSGSACPTENGPVAIDDHAGAMNVIVDWLDRVGVNARILAVGHRIVHGGLAYAAPVIINQAILDQLRSFIPLAPLHQPHNLAGVVAARDAFPSVPQIGCFDTAFHRGHDFVNDAYALPRACYERGLRRFGFHGLSYEFIARRLKLVAPAQAEQRIIVAHLGNGASLCAMRHGRSVSTTMGFSALEGLPMGTRCGAIDPGLLLYLLDHDKLSTAQLTRLLYHDSGLLGLSGVSSDMRQLEASSAPAAAEAIDYFVHRIRMEIAALAATLQGLDLLVFTGGIGQHSSRVRAAVVEGLAWMGLRLDPVANVDGAQAISSQDSAVQILTLETDEEAMIALHMRTLLRASSMREGKRD
jgi:acetate kinase